MRSLSKLVSPEVILVALILGLSWRVLSMRATGGDLAEQLDAARGSIQSQSNDIAMLRQTLLGSSLVEGTRVVGVDVDGTSRVVDLSQPPTPLMVTVVNPDCPACRTELPEVAAAFAAAGCDPHVGLGLGIGAGKGVASFADSVGVRFPVLLESSGSGWRVLPVDVSPMLVLLAADGRIAHLSNGLMTDAEWRDLERWLSESCR